MWRLASVCCLLALGAAVSPSQVHPFELVPGSGLEVGGDKDGGVAWGDIDGDGCLDAAINTTSAGTFIALQQGCTGAFDIVTTVPANRERSVLLGDINNDGHLDLIRNSSASIDIHLNNGEASPWFADTPSQQISGAINSEGLGLLDYDADGDLDLVSDSHQYGIQMYENLGPTGLFAPVELSGLPTGSQLGLGDYLAVADIEADGDVDLLVRRDTGPDLFLRDAAGFTAVQELGTAPGSNPGDKGGVTLCDLDDDGDLDAFWTDGNNTDPLVNRIWRHEQGRYELVAGPTGATGDIDGVSCGDIDNDGDLDLVLISDESDQLLTNQGDFLFERTELPGTDGDGEGSSLADIDRDGDLDLLVNQDAAAAFLLNTTNNQRYLIVDLRSGQRSAIGASAHLETCEGSVLSGLREVSGGSGHGSQDGGQVIHFGGVDPGQQVVVVARFVGGNTVRHALTPRDLGDYQQLQISETAANDLGECDNTPFGVVQMLTLHSSGGGRVIRNDIAITNTGGGVVEIVTVELSDSSGLIWEPQSCTVLVGSTVCTIDRLAAGEISRFAFEAEINPPFTATIQPVVRLQVAGQDRGEFVAESFTINAVSTTTSSPRTTTQSESTSTTDGTVESAVPTAELPPPSTTFRPGSAPASADTTSGSSDSDGNEGPGDDESAAPQPIDDSKPASSVVALVIAVLVVGGSLTVTLYRRAAET